MLFELNENKNRGKKILQKKFYDLDMSEVKHLQEIIANNTETLGEELLIIQKEFHGFDDTNERLDLLALDKNGNLVVIENKLDDSGRDVTWQIIKYASYVSTFTKEEIIKVFQEYLDKYEKDALAEEKLSEFFEVEDVDELVLNDGNTSQRLILVAGNFRKEITSSVLWLMNYGVKIQCIKATPFLSDNKIILNMEQIIPVKDIEDFVIKVSKKEREVEIIKEKKREVRVYPISHHLDGKNQDIISLFEKIDSFLINNIDFTFEKIIRKLYVAYQYNGKNIFTISFPNMHSIHVSGPVSYHLSEEVKRYNSELSFGNLIFESYIDSNARNRDYGYPKITLSSKKDFDSFVKFVKYFVDKLQ